MSDEDAQFIDEVWAKYDQDEDGAIEFEEVKQLMTEINEGIAPSTKEVKMLIKVADADRSGTIDKRELKKLIGRWFVIAEEKHQKWTMGNFTREFRQALTGCTNVVDQTNDHAVMKFPGEKEVKFWNSARDNITGNVTRSQTVTQSEIEG